MLRTRRRGDQKRGQGKGTPEEPARGLLDKDGLWVRDQFSIDQYPVWDLELAEKPHRTARYASRRSRGGLRREVGRCLRQLLGVMAVVRPRPKCVG